MIVIGENTFTVPPPKGMKSFALQQRILPVAGRLAGILVGMLGGDTKVGDLISADIEKVLPAALPAIGEVFAAMPHGELEWITRQLLADATCSVQGKATVALFGPGGDTFDALMSGKTLEVWRLLWHALEVWYPDFFGRARSFIALRAAAKPSEASATSA